MSTTKSHVLDLTRKIQALSNELSQLNYQLKLAQNTCQHTWETTYDPIVEEGYTIPGDRPGTCGVDWRGPVNVPRKETPRWKRVCTICDTSQYTEEVTEQVTKKPNFG